MCETAGGNTQDMRTRKRAKNNRRRESRNFDQNYDETTTWAQQFESFTSNKRIWKTFTSKNPEIPTKKQSGREKGTRPERTRNQNGRLRLASAASECHEKHTNTSDRQATSGDVLEPANQRRAHLKRRDTKLRMNNENCVHAWTRYSLPQYFSLWAWTDQFEGKCVRPTSYHNMLQHTTLAFTPFTENMKTGEVVTNATLPLRTISCSQ